MPCRWNVPPDLVLGSLVLAWPMSSIRSRVGRHELVANLRFSTFSSSILLAVGCVIFIRLQWSRRLPIT